MKPQETGTTEFLVSYHIGKKEEMLVYFYCFFFIAM